MNEATMDEYRAFLKDNVRRSIDFSQTDQQRGLPPPPIEKPAPRNAARIRLAPPGTWRTVAALPLAEAIRRRESRRQFRAAPLSQEELSFLLWATQGVRVKLDEGHAMRTVPSAGCRHAFETYLWVLNVDGIEPACYRYLPLSHELVIEFTEARMAEKIVDACFGQPYPGGAAVTFIWTVIPYRMEWRYGMAAHKVIALDAGHVCQNLYLACEAVGAGTCAVAAYHQEKMDRLVRVDGSDEFVIYLAPVGKVGH